MLEENATSRRARVPDRGTRKPGQRAPQRAGDAATKSAHTAAAALTRRGGGWDGPPTRRCNPEAGRTARLSRSLFSRAFRIACHPRRLAARGRHPPGPGPTPAPAPRATLTDPCGSRGRSAITQPGSAGKAPSFGAENDGQRATGARALTAAAGTLAPSEAAPHLRREANWRRGRPCLNTGHRCGSPGTGERRRAGPPGALSDATRMASSIGKAANSIACGRVCGSNVRERCSRRPEHRP